MVNRSIEKALSVIGEAAVDQQTKEEAHEYLVHLSPDEEVPQLVEALASPNFKIRWEAAEILSEIGLPALRGMLQALVDPEKAGNPCIREGIYHVLRHTKDQRVRHLTARLMKELHGFAADIKTLYEADRLLTEVFGQEGGIAAE